MYQTEKEVEKENLAGSTLYCGTFDEGSGKSGDGGIADESGEELES